MFSNFKKQMKNNLGTADCHCTTHQEIDEDEEPTHIVPSSSSRDHALPSTRSIIQVLYPSSYLGTPTPFPEPPPYIQGNIPRANGGDNISTVEPSHQPIDPLAQDPALTGVPSQGTPVPPVEPNPPIIGFGGNYSTEENEQLPAYSRFDERRPRFPTANDVLGPYPPLSAIR